MIRAAATKASIGLTFFVVTLVGVRALGWVALEVLDFNWLELLVALVILVLAWCVGDIFTALWGERARPGWNDRRTFAQRLRALW